MCEFRDPFFAGLLPDVPHPHRPHSHSLLYSSTFIVGLIEHRSLQTSIVYIQPPSPVRPPNPTARPSTQVKLPSSPTRQSSSIKPNQAFEFHQAQPGIWVPSDLSTRSPRKQLLVPLLSCYSFLLFFHLFLSPLPFFSIPSPISRTSMHTTNLHHSYLFLLLFFLLITCHQHHTPPPI